MLTNKSKYLLFYLFIFLLLLLFTGCGEQGEIEFQSVTFEGKTVVVGATISRVEKNMNDIKKPHIFYTQKDTDELQTFVYAIQRAKKIDGVVDVVTPDYLLTLTFEEI